MRSIGKLNKHVEIVTPVQQNVDGIADISTATVGMAWAEIVPVSATEQQDSGNSTLAQCTHTIRMRKQTYAVDSQCTIHWNNREFRIISVINSNEDNDELVLTCIEDV